MIAVTAAIAGAAGWALTQRISLHELSNDALAIVSHEMKTPLSSVRMLIETLARPRYALSEGRSLIALPPGARRGNRSNALPSTSAGYAAASGR